MKVYCYKGKEYDSWEACKANFPNVSFPYEGLLTSKSLLHLGITIREKPDDACANMPQDALRQMEMRSVRDEYLNLSDRFMLPDYPVESQITLDSIKAWRQYLRDYTRTDRWWDKPPMTMKEYFENEDNKGLYE